jgi:Ca2+-binding RTX toxin-like protein
MGKIGRAVRLAREGGDMAGTGDAYDFVTLEANGVADVAYNPGQTLLYAAMRNGTINVYDVVTRQKVATWQVGTQLGALSVSTDGSFLLAVERQPSANSSTFYRVDTATGAAVAVSRPGQPFWDVEIVDSDTALLSGGSAGQQTIFNMQSGTFSGLPGSVYYSGARTVLAEDDHLTLLAEPGISNGPLLLFDDRTNTIVAMGDSYQTLPTPNTTGFNYGSQAISEAAGLVLQFIYYNNVLFYDLNLKYLRQATVAGPVDGLVFDPSGRYVYVYEIDSGYLAKYDVAAWARVDQFFVGTSSWHNDIGYGSQLLISADGTRITIVDSSGAIGKLRIVDVGLRNERFDGTSDADTFAGGKGDDVYVVDHPDDTVVELAHEGDDRVGAGVASYRLSANVETLIATSDGAHDFRGNAGDNVITGGGGGDFLRLHDGGKDSAFGGAGNDVILFGGAMTWADFVDGGVGLDQLVLQGHYVGGAALLFGGGVVSVENIAILPGDDTRFGDPGTNFYDYSLTLQDATVASGIQLVIDANRLRAGENFTFDGSAESDGSFFIYGGGGTDILFGGANNDVFLFGAWGQWNPADVVVGGAGIDQLALRGNYSLTFGAGQLFGIENIGLLSAHDTRFGALGSSYSYDLTMVDGNVASGVQMVVDGAKLRVSEFFRFDGSAELDGSFRVFGGLVDDMIVASRNNDFLQGNGGMDTLTGGLGADTFRYLSASDSTVAAADKILDFTPGTDKIDLSRIDANTHAAGDQAFSWIGATAFTGSGAASAGQLRAYQSGASWFLEGDTDGNGDADFRIDLTLAGPTALGAGDFVL